jgi:hypothetical protein
MDPAPDGVLDSSNRLELLLVSVTGRPPAGAAWPIPTVQVASRFLPMVTLLQDNAKLFGMTLAITPVGAGNEPGIMAGVLNPAGVFTASVVLPELPLVNVVELLDDPPVKASTVGLTVPTALLELLTVTFTD